MSEQLESYIIRFGVPDKNGNVYTKESIDLRSLEKLIIANKIKKYVIDDIGLLVCY